MQAFGSDARLSKALHLRMSADVVIRRTPVANIDPGVTSGKECWAGAADGRKAPVEDDAVTAWLKSLGPMRPFAVTIPDAHARGCGRFDVLFIGNRKNRSSQLPTNL